MKKLIRKPAVAGQFYPAEPEQLKKDLSSYLERNLEKEEAKGIIVPHAGYIYSGPVAGAVYSRINLPDTIILLGPNHTGAGKPFSLMSEGIWGTPLGEVEIDIPVAKEILKDSHYLKEDFSAHQDEHSLEVQIPFLQILSATFKIIPIVLSGTEDKSLRAIGEEIAEALLRQKKGALLVASSDMTHYESEEAAQKKDHYALEAILKLDEEELLKRVRERNISMCGVAPVVVMITAVKRLGAKEAELVKYRTSGAVTGDLAQVVGYAGVIVK
ncbi:MAG: AmmeMemoRadiSam system protein B [Candidatus Omnitrophica bacterium]|nr:AmmeMemoRadiSam system protein B [Candidatus Omnitrophota bacterium]